MKSFKEWAILKESVTFTVKDWRPSKQTARDLLELSYHINSRLAEMAGRDAYKSGDMTNVMEKFTIDGDAFGTEGGLNFYSGGMNEALVKKLVEAAKYYIGEFGAELTGPIRKDKSGLYKSEKGEPVEVHRFPVRIKEEEAEERPPELNVANRNAGIIIRDMLNLPSQMSDYGSITAPDLLMKLSQLSDFSKGMLPIAPTAERGKGGAMFHDAGLSAEQIERYAEILEQMARWAIENDYDYIQWG